MSNTSLRRWLLLIYRLPSDPSSARSAVWRETRRLGALSLQHGVCLLPEEEATREAYSRLQNRIAEYGGEAMVLETVSPDEAWEARTVAQFNAARDEEYDEVVDETERFGEEIARERRKGKFTFAELEDEESNLERLRKYLAQVQARDTFGAPGGAGQPSDRLAGAMIDLPSRSPTTRYHSRLAGRAPWSPYGRCPPPLPPA